MEVSDQLMNVDIGLDANDLAYHHVDMEMATRIGAHLSKPSKQ